MFRILWTILDGIEGLLSKFRHKKSSEMPVKVGDPGFSGGPTHSVKNEIFQKNAQNDPLTP